MAKPKAAFYWCASCGGCEESIVDLNENILKVVEAVDIVFWPVAMDFKVEDVKKLADGEIFVSFINGAVRTSEQKEIVEMLRRKSEIIIAHGSCAHLGGIPGLANFWDKESIFKRVYFDVPSVDNQDKVVPSVKYTVEGCELTLPEFYDTVYALNQVIEVDYYLPGCPPLFDTMSNAVTALLESKVPPKCSVLTSDKALCDTCARKDTKPDETKIKEFKRVHLTEIDTERCFLDQGILCMGPATRGGCGEACINANMPCRGCYGSCSQVQDQGAKMLSALASLVDADTEEDIEKIMNGLPDPAGYFYRFGLPASLLQRRVI